MSLSLYLIEQDTNGGYDAFDSALVVADAEEDAKLIHPSGADTDDWECWGWCKNREQVSVTYIGRAAEGLEEGSVIIASFNAG